MKNLPQNYKHSEIEQKWMAEWETKGVYKWNSKIDRKNTFVVDTPPPTVSGSLHVGHVFSYTHTDIITRYQRMLGKNIMYPMGWDDNGLPTERRVQNKFGISCNVELAYDPNWKPAPSENKVEVSRRNFIEACQIVTAEDELAFETLWRNLALSVDWSEQYSTIGEHCRKISQLSFIDLAKKGLVYTADAPTMWDVTYQTALAQADIEDREKDGAYHDISFTIDGPENSIREDFIISTTRPELLVSCIAVVAHPDDERYQKYFGKHAITPLYKARVPIVASDHADPTKGTGILMVCTFGDAADVEWWKKSGLPIKQVIDREGRFINVDFKDGSFASIDPEAAAKNFSQVTGKRVKQARNATVELLRAEGTLVAEPKPIKHPVKFYEKGDEPLEFIVTRQWFVKLLDYKKELLEQGKKISWHPEHMRHRYDNWVEGLGYDWCISRQRFFGVPFPVWYPIDSNGAVDYQKPIFSEQLPVDPLSEAPAGYKEEQRGKANGFIGDPDVMDTWATSSLTPQIVSKWGIENDRHQKLFPADIRPQSHEIIRTWAFYTIAKAYLHEKEIPWKHVVISGWILDPDRKKMSKSKGNVVTPQHLLEQYSADAVRYWAARARLGVDTAYDESVFKIGLKLSTKLFNASKFAITNIQAFESEFGAIDAAKIKIDNKLDLSFLSQLANVVEVSTKALENFDYAQALQVVESLFWNFCDSYVELVKTRAYQGEQAGKASAIAALDLTIKTFLRLLAPFMPYVTEEIWSWRYSDQSISDQSIHTSAWPTLAEFPKVSTDSSSEFFDVATEVLAKIHHSKSVAQKSLKWPVTKVEIQGSANKLLCLSEVVSDIYLAGKVVDNGILLNKTEPNKELANELIINVTLSSEAA